MKIRAIIIILLATLQGLQGCKSSQVPIAVPTTINEVLSQVSEREILATACDLQGFVTRKTGSQGNIDAATYLFKRFAAIPGLNVTYQGGSQRNVIATLKGTGKSSNKVYIAGGHYDSTSGTPGLAPGATDNACGTGIVLELARVLSKYRFKNDLKFAVWNSEESGGSGSKNYIGEAVLNHEPIALYINFDSSGYDPSNNLILDIIFNDNSSSIAKLMEKDNSVYGLGFTITHNVHTCFSDHKSFWAKGFCSVMTHSEQHGPAHTVNDTADKISTRYARKNGQLGMAILAELAEISTR